MGLPAPPSGAASTPGDEQLGDSPGEDDMDKLE
jgi:hypothetical protein